ncbi:MAG: sugar transferase, partial [Bryobacterales bacterium]|nr:sugar transferase [Bryobacterales bacterium]
GLAGKPFHVLKFRTMIENAPDLRNADGSTYSGSEDPRVTSIGRLLRTSSLDELPQLWNVLVGDMSIVGPRPDQVDQLRYYTDEDLVKLQVRPGITGLAQISGRNSIPWELRRRLDCSYARNWTLWLDLRIMAKTIPYVVLRRDIHQNGDVTVPGAAAPANQGRQQRLPENADVSPNRL